MSSKNNATIVVPILIIVLGVGWLLTAKRVGPGIDWVWTLGLGVVGILTFVLSKGIDKVSVVVGPFFLLASVLSVLRQTEKITFDVEVPVLVIGLGALLLVARFPGIPTPGWAEELPPAPPPAESSAPKKLRLEDTPQTTGRWAAPAGHRSTIMT